MFEEIAQDIKAQREHEIEEYANLLAVGLANVVLNSEHKKFWLYNKLPDGNRVREEIGGARIIAQNRRHVVSNGHNVSKNSIAGEKIITKLYGPANYEVRGNTYTLNIENSTFYTPHSTIAEAINIAINHGTSQPKRFESLTYILGEVHQRQQEVETLEEEIEDATSNDVDEEKLKDLQDKLEQARRNQIEAQQKARKFIIRNAELRYTAILDPYQDAIRRSNRFTNTIAIDGGPGTGKTLSLIQRINFLRDEEAIEDYMDSLSNSQKAKLRTLNNWIFFSPNELLMLFLKSSMKEEGLRVTENNTVVWNNYKQELIKQYKFVDTENQNPFLFLLQRNYEELLPQRAVHLKKVIKSFETFILEKEKNKFEKTCSIKCGQFGWHRTGVSIQNYLTLENRTLTIADTLRLYYNLENQYKDEVKEISAQYKEILDRSAISLLALAQEDKELYDLFKELIKDWGNEQEEIDEEDIEDGVDDELENIDLDIDNKVLSKFKALARKLSLIELKDNIRLTKKDQSLLELFHLAEIEISASIDLKKLGELSLFDKYFRKLVNGFDRNLLNAIPRYYKLFRRSQLRDKSNKWNFDLLDFIVNSDHSKNKRIHPDEQALLLYFTNGIIHRCFKSFKRRTEASKNKYIRAYNHFSKCIIGVDEATDFHLVDLIAMKNLEDFEIGSTTYSGDLMQRLTKSGLRDWEDLGKFISNFETKELKISYRQSPTLLQVAEDIYNTYFNSTREFESFTSRDENEPTPLIFESEDEEAKIQWISERIIEIYRAYGNHIPSIAIFLSEESSINQFAEKLGNIDRLADVGITVRACNNGQVLGKTNTVRVFSIEYIKGLEFEAVFYHDIHDLFLMEDKEMMMKNLYVGLSRASFYLGITTAPEFDEELQFVRRQTDSSKQNWK